MAQTMEQQRAADAWANCKGCSGPYQNLAKGLPALIMNSGLMQVLAFMHAKGAEQHLSLEDHLLTWLHKRFPTVLPKPDFASVMQGLMGAQPADFQHITAEALAWLRWTRQMASAVGKKSEP